MTSCLTIRIERDVKPVSCAILLLLLGFVDVESLKSVEVKEGYFWVSWVMCCFREES